MPAVFTDRSLGDFQVPDGLRAAGFEVHTMAEIYGQAEAQSLDDPAWIRDMTDCNLLLFSKDAAIQKAHIYEVAACGARAFLLPEQQTKAKDQVARYVKFKHKIAVHAQKPGPLLYLLRPQKPEKLALPTV